MISNPTEFKEAELLIKSYSNKRSALPRTGLLTPNSANIDIITSAQSTRVTNSQTCASKNNESVPKRDLTKPKTTNARPIASAVDLFLTACGVPGAK